MKRINLLPYTLSGITALLALAACSDDVDYGNRNDGSTGKVKLNLEVDGSPVTSTSSRAATVEELAKSVTASDFTVRITSDDESYQEEWAFDDFTNAELTIGKYSVLAYYVSPGCNIGDEGFNRPYFAAEDVITIKTDQTTTVSLQAKFANAAIDLDYTDAFKSYLPASMAYIVTTTNPSGLEYPADQVDDIFINPGDIDLYVKVELPDGSGYTTLDVNTLTVEAQHKYNIILDVNEGEIGDAVFTITFDDMLNIEPVSFTLNDDLFNAPAPEIAVSAQELSYVAGTLSQDVTFTVAAQGGLSKVMLTTQSDNLPEGWPTEIDLMGADTATQTLLKSLGLSAIGLWNNPGEVAEIDLTSLANTLEGSSTPTVFTLTATDKYGKVSDPAATITLNITPVELTVISNSVVYPGDTQVTIDFTYNGAVLTTDNLSVSNYVEGAWQTDAKILSLERNGETYTIEVSFESDNGSDNIPLRLSTGVLTAYYTITRQGFVMSLSENNVFATYATATMEYSSALTEGGVTISELQLSTDGGSTWIDATYTANTDKTVLSLSSLTPATNYQLKVTVGEYTQQTAFTTEAATQLPNASFENWTTEKITTDYQLVYYPGTATSGNDWDTMNLLTTSTSGTGNSIFSYGGSAYRAHSGTQYTTDANTGTYAAKIMTIGWGSSNTSFGTSGACSNITPGELYLGSYNSSNKSPDYGYTFASRPSSMTFQYKLCVVSTDDYASAEITIYDASSNVIATGYKKIDEYMKTISGATYMSTDDGLSSCDFKEVTIPLSYETGAAKAAKISVVFKSSDNSDMWKWSSSCLCYPGSANYKDGIYSGARLIIDDVTLNY